MNAQQPVQEDLSQYEVQPMVDDFQQYEVHPTEESTLAYLGRGAVRVASRLGEMALGLPEDLRQLAGGIGIKAAEAITGKEAPFTRQQLAKGQVLSSSSDIRKELAERTEGYTEPQTPGEEKADEFLTDVALLGLPIKGKIPFQRAIGTAIAGHLAKEGVAKFGGAETTQDLAKLGAFFTAGLVRGPGAANKYVNSLYKERNDLLPSGADVDATVLNRSLSSLKTNLEKGVPGTAENAVLKYVDTLLQKTQGGRIAVDELTAVKPQINARISELVSKEGIKRKDARQKFKVLGNDIEKTIEAYGKTNPEFLKLHKNANQAYGAIEESKKVSQFIREHVPNANKLAVGLALETYALGATAAVKTLGGAAVGYGSLKGMELISRINNSPVLRKYYLGVLENAMKENAAATAGNLRALDHAMKKEDPELYNVLKNQLSSSE